jgi:hypothetical protein
MLAYVCYKMTAGLKKFHAQQSLRELLNNDRFARTQRLLWV